MDIEEDFTKLRLRFTDPVQHDYEVIRPVVLAESDVPNMSRFM